MKAILFANSDWYLFNFRLSFARALREAGYEVLLISPPGSYGRALEAQGFRWIALPMERQSLNLVREIKLLMNLTRLYRRESPDLVHHFTIKSVVYGSLAARMAGIRTRVNAIAGMGYVFTNPSLKARLLRPVIWGLMRLVLGGERSRLILQNNDDAQSFLKSGLCQKENMHVIKGSGVDLSRFRPLKLGAQRANMTVVLAARLLWDKGIAEYVAAARQLKGEGLKLRFLLAGSPDEGNPSSIPQTTLNDWDMEGVVEILGHVHDMPQLFMSADIAVLPSYREGLPKSLIEAAACGLALVTTDVPGCREVVDHESDGLLVPARDAAALASAIRRLYQAPEWAQSLGRAARARAFAEFDEKIVLQRTLDVYRELIVVSTRAA